MRGPHEPTEPQMILQPADLAYVELLLRRIFFMVFLGVVFVFITAVILLAIGTDLANEISNLTYLIGQGKK
jgi:hypothetical protein